MLLYLAHVTLPLSEVRDTDCYDKWHQLIPNTEYSRGETGSLRIRARYLHEIIMPEDKYSTLKEVQYYKASCMLN